MTDATNKASARAYFEQFLNKGDMAAADEIFAPDVQFHYPLDDLSGVTAVKSYVSAVRTAFPDIQFTIADLITEQDRIAARWSLVGSQTGEFRGNPPTNKTVGVSGITIFNFEDGKIEEMWIAFDPARLIDD